MHWNGLAKIIFRRKKTKTEVVSKSENWPGKDAGD